MGSPILTGHAVPDGIVLARGGRVVAVFRLPSGSVAVGSAEVPAASTAPFLRGLALFFETAFPRIAWESWVEELIALDAEPASLVIRRLPLVERREIAGPALKKIVFGFVLALLPQVAADVLLRVLGSPLPLHVPAFHAVTALVTLALMIVYARLVVGFPDVRGAFQYNAVLLRTIAAADFGGPIEKETLRSERSFHPLAGSTTMFLVVLITMAGVMIAGTVQPLMFGGGTVVGHALLALFKVAIFPLVASVVHELQLGLCRLYRAPALRGLLRTLFGFQFLWVREPTNEQLHLGPVAYRELTASGGEE